MERGRPLGLVGLSGKTAFPHVHLTVRRNGQVVDPFTGRLQSAGCGGEEKPLWRVDAHVAYEEVALYNAGFSDGQPDIETIRNGQVSQSTLSPTSTALVLWVDLLGVQAGDQVRFRVTGPDGRLVLDKVDRVTRTQARRFSYADQRLRATAWAPGSYSGEVTLSRTVGGQLMERSINRTAMIQ